MYQAPSPVDLIKSINALLEDYQKKGFNKDRKEDIQLLQSLVKEPYEELMGACVFILEKIYSEYHWTSAENSKLYVLLKQALKINDKNNVLDDATRFTYLMNFYRQKNFLAKNPLEQVLNAVAKRLKPLIGTVLKRPPTDGALLNNFAKIPSEYHKKHRGSSYLPTMFGGHDPERDRWCKFIDLMHASLAKDAVSLRYSVLLHCMMNIEGKYTFSSPYHTAFYSECRRALNIDSTIDLDKDVKKKYLSELLHYISKIKTSPEEVAVWEKNGLRKAKDFFSTMQDALTDEMVVLKDANDLGFSSARMNGYIHSLETYAAQYGVTLALTGAIQWAISSVAFPSLMMCVLSPEYAVTMALLILLQQQLKSGVVSMVANQISPLMTSVVKLPMKIAYNSVSGLTNLIYNLHATLEQMSYEESAFIKALYDAPDTVISKEQKEQLKIIFDFEDKKPAKIKNVDEEYTATIIEPGAMTALAMR